MMSLLSMKDCLNMELIPSSEMTPSVISWNFRMLFGMFMTLSSNLSLESWCFHSNRFMGTMNFWSFVLNHSQIRIAMALVPCSATLLTIFRLVQKSTSACLAMMAGMVKERGKSKGQIEFIFSCFWYTHFYSHITSEYMPLEFSFTTITPTSLFKKSFLDNIKPAADHLKEWKNGVYWIIQSKWNETPIVIIRPSLPAFYFPVPSRPTHRYHERQSSLVWMNTSSVTCVSRWRARAKMEQLLVLGS